VNQLFKWRAHVHKVVVLLTRFSDSDIPIGDDRGLA